MPTINRRLRDRLWSLGERQCAYCGCKFPTVRDATLDHIRPTCQGGMNNTENLVLSCRQCNHQKARYARKPVFVRGNVMEYGYKLTPRGSNRTAYKIKRDAANANH